MSIDRPVRFIAVAVRETMRGIVTNDRIPLLPLGDLQLYDELKNLTMMNDKSHPIAYIGIQITDVRDTIHSSWPLLAIGFSPELMCIVRR